MLVDIPKELSPKDKTTIVLRAADSEVRLNLPGNHDQLAVAVLEAMDALRFLRKRFNTPGLVLTPEMLKFAGVTTFEELGVKEVPREPVGAVVLTNAAGFTDGRNHEGGHRLLLFKTVSPVTSPSIPLEPNARLWLRGVEANMGIARIGDSLPQLDTKIDRKYGLIHAQAGLVIRRTLFAA
jgi:hypothetical protein